MNAIEEATYGRFSDACKGDCIMFSSILGNFFFGHPTSNRGRATETPVPKRL